jgi:hypothetical protein
MYTSAVLDKSLDNDVTSRRLRAPFGIEILNIILDAAQKP